MLINPAGLSSRQSSCALQRSQQLTSQPLFGWTQLWIPPVDPISRDRATAENDRIDERHELSNAASVST